MIVLDTTVLVYAVGSEHAYRDPCRTLLEAVTAGEIEATTTAEVVQKFAHVRARRRDRNDAAEHALLRLLSPLLPVGEQDVRDGLAIWLRSESLGVFDSVLAATAIAHNAEALVSADREFTGIRGVLHVLPSVKGVAGADPVGRTAVPGSGQRRTRRTAHVIGLVYAFRESAAQHEIYRDWLGELLDSQVRAHLGRRGHRPDHDHSAASGISWRATVSDRWRAPAAGVSLLVAD